MWKKQNGLPWKKSKSENKENEPGLPWKRDNKPGLSWRSDSKPGLHWQSGKSNAYTSVWRGGDKNEIKKQSIKAVDA